jgi:hypothetical protein
MKTTAKDIKAQAIKDGGLKGLGGITRLYENV